MRRDPILDSVFGLYAFAMKAALVQAFEEVLAWPFVLVLLCSIACIGLASTIAHQVVSRH